MVYTIASKTVLRRISRLHEGFMCEISQVYLTMQKSTNM
jgi:hypothetical protein